MKKPCIIEFSSFGKSEEGYLSIASANDLPFKIQRVFWTYQTPSDIIRGKHAHHTTQMVIIAVQGSIRVDCVGKWGQNTFILDSPKIGLYIPSYCWHSMHYSHQALQLVIADTDYNESDYIRNFDDFINIIQS